MDLTFSERETAFRDELRAWLADNQLDPEPTEGGEDAKNAWRHDWQRRLYDAGWAAPHWPAEYGGRGVTPSESAIYFEEIGRARVPLPANILGLLLGGPTLMVWGTDEQKERYLTPILSAEEIWCQGFSEPEAGSDLASLKTRAVKDDGGFRVTGQKVWTSSAQWAKWCMLVARTDPEAPKHKGLTYFLLDMEQDEVEVRPLRQITGEAEFNELFFEDAWIPDENVVGGVGNGWAVAITTLMNERAGLGAAAALGLRSGLVEMVAIANERGLGGDAVVRERIAKLHIGIEALRLGALRTLTTTMRTGTPGPEGSISKLQWADLNQELTNLATDVLGAEGLSWGEEWTHRWLRSQANSIEGGTSDVLKNIVAERVLGLPRLR
jgi:alkylation response protein AidB-like acyl-CoA dehydrogenase